MLVLQEKDIQYCQVINEKTTQITPELRIYYRGFLFKRAASFPNKQIQQAKKLCRHFLEEKANLTTIVLEEQDIVTVWSETRKLTLLEYISNIESETKIVKLVDPLSIRTNPNKSKNQRLHLALLVLGLLII